LLETRLTPSWGGGFVAASMEPRVAFSPSDFRRG
jgi:hypothetical protein